jgi:hypothetical protein
MKTKFWYVVVDGQFLQPEEKVFGEKEKAKTFFFQITAMYTSYRHPGSRVVLGGELVKK